MQKKASHYIWICGHGAVTPNGNGKHNYLKTFCYDCRAGRTKPTLVPKTINK